MFDLFRRRRPAAGGGHQGDATPQSRIEDALREIDRHLARGGPAGDALLDVRLKLSPPAPSDGRTTPLWMEHAEYGPFGLLGLLFFDSYPAMYPEGNDRQAR